MEKNKYGLIWLLQKPRGIFWQLALYTLLALCLPVIQLLFAYCMKLFIDIATGSAQMPLLAVGGRSAALVAVGGVAILANAALSKWIAGKMECGLRGEVLATIFSRRLLDISGQHTGELLARLVSDVQAVSACCTGVIDNVLGGAVSVLLAGAALFLLNWKIALLLLALAPLLLLLLGSLTPHIQQASGRDKQNEAKNCSLLQESLGRMVLIKTYAMHKKTIEKVSRAYQDKLKSGVALGMWEGLASFAGVLCGNMMSLATLGVGAYFVTRGETTVGSLIMIVQLLNYIVNPAAKFSGAVAQISQAAASAGRIGALYALPAERALPPAAPVEATELVARGVRFSYGGQQAGGDDLLRDVSVTFRKGELTGIVGKSGCGKSTLLRLLIGLYAPREGTIVLKHASGALAGEEIMAQAAYVPPGDYLFSGSIADNIVMAGEEARPAALWAAAKSANIAPFIQSLPLGFDTPVGEGGGAVSSGQAQRIAIARAIYKGACVVVFDEPTANLDAEAVEKFQSAAKCLAKDKICILVTHDPSTARVCDKVYELVNGGVIEREARCGQGV